MLIDVSIIWAAIATVSTIYFALTKHKLEKIQSTKLIGKDLYEKRMEIFTELQDVFDKIVQDGEITTELFIGIKRVKENCFFFFGDEIELYVSTVDDRAHVFLSQTTSLKKYPANTPERKAKVAEESASLKWFINERVKLPLIFADYLRVTLASSTKQKKFIQQQLQRE